MPTKIHCAPSGASGRSGEKKSYDLRAMALKKTHPLDSGLAEEMQLESQEPTSPRRRDPQIGQRLSHRTFTIDDSTLEDYYSGLDLEPPNSGLIPSTIATGPDGDYFTEIAFSNHVGHLWMRQKWELSGPLERGQAHEVGGAIRDIYPRRDRTVVQYEVELTDSSGQRMLLTQHHQSFLRDRDHTGEVSFRDPRAKPGARKFEVPEGEPFGGLERTISLEMCGEYFHGNANYHTDRDSSKELGFGDVVVGGRMTMAYAAHILEERFGEAWWLSGTFDLKFTNPVWPDDTVIARGVVTGPDPGGERTGAFVWLSKPDDTVVLVANASVAL